MDFLPKNVSLRLDEESLLRKDEQERSSLYPPTRPRPSVRPSATSSSSSYPYSLFDKRHRGPSASLRSVLPNYFARKVRKAPERPTKEERRRYLVGSFIILYYPQNRPHPLIRDRPNALPFDLKLISSLMLSEFHQRRTNPD